MKKATKYIIILSLVALISIGGTYAFFSATVTSNEKIISKGDVLEVIYDGDEEIKGDINLVKTKEDGFRREVSIRLTEESVDAVANIFVQIDQITPNIAVKGLKWEVYKIDGESETLYRTGTFLDCGKIEETKTKCVSGGRIYMITNYQILRTDTRFAIYFWLNGYEVDNNVLGGSLNGYIAAETENITAQIS